MFPLDDEPLVSDYLTYPSEGTNDHIYGVQM